MKYEAAYTYHNRALAYLRARTEVFGMDSIEADPVRITVAVEDWGNEARVGLRVMEKNAATLQAIEEMKAEGAIPDDIEVQEIGRVIGLLGPTDLVAPLRAGVSCANIDGAPGTLGCIVRKRGIDDGKRYVLSVNHVLALEGRADPQSEILQPVNGASNFRTIGNLSEAKDLVSSGNLMDGAIALLSVNDLDAALFNGKRITKLRKPPLIANEPIFKFGQASNGTEGKALATLASPVSITMHFGTYSFDQQFEIVSTGTPFAVRGDSGALVYDKDDAAVGLIIGGNQSDRTYVTPIRVLLDAFGVDLV